MTPSTTNVSHTPTDCGVAKRFIRKSASGLPIIAPPPNPMIASPVAMPRRSGNHLINVDTGEMYPSPSPQPPMTPSPIHSSQIWCRCTPTAPIRNPPAQQHAATNPALRGPSRSAHRPNNAADDPRKKIASVNVIVSVLTFQSPGADDVTPIALLSGSQNTLRP